MDGVNCPICGATAQLINDRHPGYQHPQVFSIFGCQYCDLQFSWPINATTDVYEHIYRQASSLPGYDFYAGLARQLEAQSDPLSWLAQQASGYWFIQDALRAKLPTKRGRILEIGSGLGYLTHAMRAAGYDATGLDISANAVSGANTRFGNHYVCADLEDFAHKKPASRDAIVMMEVIEHSPSPIAMLNAAFTLLKPGGFALITTPNKSVYRAGDYWQTDNPPVHLWWFSETSARRLAQSSRFDVSFWDFIQLHQPNIDDRHPSITPMKPPFLDERGNVIIRRKTPSSPTRMGFRKLKALRDRWLPAIKDAKRARRRQQARLRWADEHGDVMGLVLTKPTA